jgi:hypothetical protein
MMPGIQFGLGIVNGQVSIRFVETAGGPQIQRPITSVEDFLTFIKAKADAAHCDPDDLIIMCSSSMDFPEEYTKDPKVIKLANDLR